MRILYITDALAVWGGIERVLSDKTSYLARLYGYDVHIVTTDQGDHPIPYPLDERVKVHDLDIKYHYQYKYRGLTRLLEYWKLNRLFLKRLKDAVSEIQPDVIVCIRIESVKIILKAKGDIPLICESHSLCYAYKYEKTSLLHRLNFQIVLRSVRKADCIVALTEGDANDWRKYNSNVVVIPNVVHLNETGRFSDLKSKIVIFAGRFSVQKDVWSLLKIWRIVFQNHPDWELHVYGEGEFREDFIKEVSKDDIGIKVFHPTPEIFDRYLHSSMLVMTSCYEPFGLVLPEAMSCGLPVIAFNCPYGPEDIITNGKDGMLVENRDVVLFAEKILFLINNYTIRNEMGKYAVISSQRYNYKEIMQKWINLFEIYR